MLGWIEWLCGTCVFVGEESFFGNRRHVSSDLWQHEGVVSLSCGGDVFLVVILVCEDHRSRVWILVLIDANDDVVVHRRYWNPHIPSDCLWNRLGTQRQVRSRTGTDVHLHIVTTHISNTDELHTLPDVVPRMPVAIFFRSCFSCAFLSVCVLFCCVVSSHLSFSVGRCLCFFLLDRCVCCLVCLVCHVSYFSFDKSVFPNLQLWIDSAVS